MFLDRVLRTVFFVIIAGALLYALQNLLPLSARTLPAEPRFVGWWTCFVLYVLFVEIFSGNEKSRAAMEELLVTYQTESIAHTAGLEILGVVIMIAEGEPRHRSIPIVRCVVDFAIRGDVIALEALTKVPPAILSRAIRSDSLYDRIWGSDYRLWHGLMDKATSGDGVENARKLMCFGLGLRTALHLPTDLTKQEQTACSKMLQGFAPQGAL